MIRKTDLPGQGGFDIISEQLYTTKIYGGVMLLTRKVKNKTLRKSPRGTFIGRTVDYNGPRIPGDSAFTYMLGASIEEGPLWWGYRTNLYCTV